MDSVHSSSYYIGMYVHVITHNHTSYQCFVLKTLVMAWCCSVTLQGTVHIVQHCPIAPDYLVIPVFCIIKEQ